jgi:hypothetical protein
MLLTQPGAHRREKEIQNMFIPWGEGEREEKKKKEKKYST